VNGLIFTRDDGRPITKGMIEYQIEAVLKSTGVKKFTFHNYRNTALTEWARRGINVDLAMKASGHSTNDISIWRKRMSLRLFELLRIWKLLQELLRVPREPLISS
jgi:integrase